MAGRLRAFTESCHSSQRGTLKRKVTNIRRGDSGQRKQYDVQRAKLHGAAVGAYIKGAGAVWLICETGLPRTLASTWRLR